MSALLEIFGLGSPAKRVMMRNGDTASGTFSRLSYDEVRRLYPDAWAEFEDEGLAGTGTWEIQDLGHRTRLLWTDESERVTTVYRPDLPPGLSGLARQELNTPWSDRRLARARALPKRR